ALVVLSSWPDQTGEGTLGLRGLTVDGQTDTEFGTAGWVESADSRNVVATPTGFVTHGFGAMASFDVTGTPDSGFASASPLNVTSVAADDDGRLLVGGVSDGMHYAVQRLHPDGGLDGTFGTAGTLSILLPPFAGKDAVIYDLRSMGDAGGVAVGSSNVGGLSENIPVLIRFDTDGEVDAGFGSGGLADVLESGELGGVDIVRVQSDGRLLVVGYLHEGGFDTTPLLLRFNPDGSPDTTFGANGRFELAQFPRDIAIDAGAERVLVLADQEGGQGGVLLTRIWL
ncbi:MAG: hypothetical protein KTR31_32735, partial [Myxococcales bacterium]|nr:hypothetical protein [Myxococcales bacterium]